MGYTTRVCRFMRRFKGKCLLLCSLLLWVCTVTAGCAKEHFQSAKGGAAMAASSDFTVRTSVREIRQAPAFDGMGDLLLPHAYDIPDGTRLEDLDRCLPWYTNIRPEMTAAVLNRLRQDGEAGRQVIYPLYSEEEIRRDPTKGRTALVFFRGMKGARTAVVNAGGGFVYVGAIHDSFPHALALSAMGYNVFCPIYRPDAELACEDLSRALIFLFDHAEELGISMQGYSLWGGSAGARMADWVGTFGTEKFAGRAVPRPAAVIMAYTGLRDVTGREVPTYSVVGSKDPIADARVMRHRTQELRRCGIDAEIEVFPGLSHGFGVGTGTVAEDWVRRAAGFWERHIGEVRGTGRDVLDSQEEYEES